jgi:hypothetical protein
VQLEPWQIQVRNRSCGVKACENVTELLRMFCNHAARVVVLVAAFQPFVADRS